MTDHNIISRLSFNYNAGCGRGGFETEVERFTLYDEQSVLYHLSGRYVNPVGPFRKYVVISADVYSLRYHSVLKLTDDFWSAITKEVFLTKYMIPFLDKIRRIVEEGVRVKETKPELIGYRTDMLRERSYYEEMLERLPNLLDVSREECKGYF